MIDKKTFKKAFGAPFERAGFAHKGQSWYLDGKDAIIVINLQHSDWGKWYFVNMGIWLKAFGTASFPQFNHCHLYYRIEDFFPQNREEIVLGCSLEARDPQMLPRLVKFIENSLVSFLYECTQESKLREMMAQGSLNNGLVLKEARSYLTMSDPIP